MRYFNLNNLVIHDITQDISNVGYAIHSPVDGLDSPNYRFAGQDKPGEHGGIMMNQLYGPRIVNLTGIVQQDTIQAFYTAKRNLQAAVRIVKNNYVSQPFLSKFTTDDGLLLQFLGWVNTKPIIPIGTPTKTSFMLTIYAADPYLYNQTASTDTLLRGNTHSVTDLGDANSYLTATYNGPLTNPLLTNAVTGETFKLDYTVASGHQVVVDMQAKTIVLDGTTNENAAWDNNNTWLALVPGAQNMTLNSDSGGDTGNVVLSWRDAWVGS